MMENRGNVPERDGVPMYDSDFVAELIAEGHSHEDAVRIASGETGGANETPAGTIRSTQTNCNVLHYKETLEEPKEVRRARKKVESQVRKEMGLNEDADIDEEVDKWIKEQEKKVEEKRKEKMSKMEKAIYGGKYE